MALTANHSPRVAAKLKKYAPYIGGEDADGRFYKEDLAKNHLFVVRNKDLEAPHWAFVLGHVVAGLIVDDCYDIEYLGLHRDFIPLFRYVEQKDATDKPTGIFDKVALDPKTSAQKEMRKKALKYFKKQEADIKYQNKVNNEAQGIYEYDDSVSDEDELETEA